MNEQNYNPENEQQSGSSSHTWEDVGKQFQNLGETLAAALRTSLNNEETRRQFQKMQYGLEGMVAEIRQAITETVDAADVDQVKQDARKAAETLADHGRQTYQEVRPHLIDALQQVNQELQNLIDRMQDRKEAPSGQEDR